MHNYANAVLCRYPGVWTIHTFQTGCATGFSRLRLRLCAYLLAKTVPALSKWSEKRLGSSLVLKLYCIILRACSTGFLHNFFRVIFFSLHFSRANKNLCYQGSVIYVDILENLSYVAV